MELCKKGELIKTWLFGRQPIKRHLEKESDDFWMNESI
jgi:hypothetical protein